jgi:hypothetical protein
MAQVVEHLCEALSSNISTAKTTTENSYLARSPRQLWEPQHPNSKDFPFF